MALVCNFCIIFITPVSQCVARKSSEVMASWLGGCESNSHPLFPDRLWIPRLM